MDDTLDGVLGRTTALPDLVPDVTQVYAEYDFFWDPQSQTFLPYPILRFDTWAQNFGPVALDLLTEDATNLQDPPVSQCISWSGRICRERQEVGGFVVHPTHGHMHFEDFARYEFRRLLTDGTPDYSSSGLIAVSEKVSFCLVDSQTVSDDADPVATYLACTAVREGISAGWSDIYGATLDGQALPIGTLPDGQYAVVVSLNPTQNVLESNYTNNRVAITVEIDSSSGTHAATIVGRSYS